MKSTLVLLGLALLPDVAFGCVITRVIPEHLVTADSLVIERHFLKESFEGAAIVIEVKVSSLEVHGAYTLVHIAPVHTWKSDGRPIQYIFLPYAYPAQCSPTIEVGRIYAVFAVRAQNILPSVKVASQPLALRHDSIERINASARDYLDSLAITWVRIVDAAPPNNQLQRTVNDKVLTSTAPRPAAELGR